MDRYIGLDVHAVSCTLGVLGPSGKRLKSMVVETNGQALLEAVRSIPGRIHLCLEEGTQSACPSALGLESGVARCKMFAGAWEKIRLDNSFLRSARATARMEARR